ncbi:hypothetical protein BFW38_12475 [Terasakiispira papahanaumokuakeensis]|uniref:Uncharacterized protein n=1 Tax=Terasakiispira papahanaumokuakeensis TaxID=197479 RepID=A0A1E2VB82_9GAMM|nr:hypothetical protein [Terasakiispira papahanaumokuakeensis]ODC04224.1 hypothetical protein BFW38_12475 [Terasakiispira papahanaumokuakeensis]
MTDDQSTVSGLKHSLMKRHERDKVMVLDKLRQIPDIIKAWWRQEWQAIQQLRREDWRLAEAGQWPELLKVLLTIICQIGLLWLGYHYLLASRLDSWQHMQQRHQQLSEQWQALSQQSQDGSMAHPLSTLAPNESGGVSHHSTLNTDESLGMASAQVPQWTQLLEHHFNQAEIKLTAFSLAHPQRYADWQAQPFQLQLIGHYSDLAQSLGQLSAITPLLTWHDFTLQPALEDTNDSPELAHRPDLSMTIHGRLLLSTQEENDPSPQPHKQAEWHALEGKALTTHYQFPGDPNRSPMSPLETAKRVSPPTTPKTETTKTETRASPPPLGTDSPKAPPLTAPALKIAGVIQYQRQHRALVQTTDQPWLWVQPGDAVAGGYISNITMNELIWTESLKDETTQHHYDVKATGPQ